MRNLEWEASNLTLVDLSIKDSFNSGRRPVPSNSHSFIQLVRHTLNAHNEKGDKTMGISLGCSDFMWNKRA